MHNTAEEKERAVLAGVHTGAKDVLSDTTDESMAELCELCETCGAEVCAALVQNRENPDGATYLGEGKLEELKNACAELGADLVVTDDALTGSQVRNMEEFLDVRVIDRNTLILDIFAQRAQSREGKIQVELAQLSYMLPRLSGIGASMSRLGAGIGTRGPGESKLESDRRHIRRRIDALKDELAEVQKRRGLTRGRRKKDGVLTVSLVGYTNVGKSTLLNALTGSAVTAKNRLFETLDTTSRALELEDGRAPLFIDTVGFIRRLPHSFVEAFKSTLEEAAASDLLLHVIDASSEQMTWQMEVVERLLDELGAGAIPKIAVFNKCDKIASLDENMPRLLEKYEKTVNISAKTGEGLAELVRAVSEVLPGKKKKGCFLIPYSEGQLLAMLHDEQVVLSEEFLEGGTKICALVDDAAWGRVAPYEAL